MQINGKIKRFYLGNIRKELKAVVKNLSKQVYVPFPKEERRWISNYVYREFEIHIDSKGSIKGGLLRLIFSLVNFSFVRSLVADCYSNEGGDCHDPVILFLLEVIKIWAGYTCYPEFIEDLKDNEKGSQYRYYAGVYRECPYRSYTSQFKGQVCLKKGKLVITYAKCIKARRRLEELIGYEPPAKEKIPEGRRKEIKNRFNERKQPIEGQVRLLAM